MNRYMSQVPLCPRCSGYHGYHYPDCRLGRGKVTLMALAVTLLLCVNEIGCNGPQGTGLELDSPAEQCSEFQQEFSEMVAIYGEIVAYVSYGPFLFAYPDGSTLNLLVRESDCIRLGF